MRKISVFFLLFCFTFVGYVLAEDPKQEASAPSTDVKEVAAVANPVTPPEAPKAEAVPVPALPAAPVEPAVPAAPAAPSTAVAQAEAPAAAAPGGNAADNLEFVSGEISALDEAAKTITVKLYGEAEANAKDKLLNVTVDTTTDITDGEKDRDLKSLTAGTEVDVEYDPATKKATYIFVY